MQPMSPFYTFLTYLQFGTIITMFLLTLTGSVVAALAVKALLIYIRKNSAPKTAAEKGKDALSSEASAEEAEEAADEAVENAEEEAADEAAEKDGGK